MYQLSRVRRSVVAAGCAIALGTMLGACTSTSSSAAPKGGVTGTAPIPSTTPTTGSGSATSASSASGTPHSTSTTSTTPASPPSTPTPASPPSSPDPAPAPVIGAFLTADQLPDAAAYRWTRQYITAVHVEEPLPATCNNALGLESNQTAWSALYPAADGNQSAEAQLHIYTSDSYAASRVAASYPKCGGVTAHTADGFAWRGTSDGHQIHVIFARSHNKVGTLVIRADKRDYDASLDVKVLQAMTQRLSAS